MSIVVSSNQSIECRWRGKPLVWKLPEGSVTYRDEKEMTRSIAFKDGMTFPYDGHLAFDLPVCVRKEGGSTRIIPLIGRAHIFSRPKGLDIDSLLPSDAPASFMTSSLASRIDNTCIVIRKHLCAKVHEVAKIIVTPHFVCEMAIISLSDQQDQLIKTALEYSDFVEEKKPLELEEIELSIS